MTKRLIACLLALSLLLSGMVSGQAAQKTLRSGSKGSEVKTLQTALYKLGLYSKAIDGVYGKGTAAAVRLFQSKKGLKADGIAGPKTLSALYGSAGSEALPSPAGNAELTVGAKGSEVKTLQNALKKLGYYTKTVDGSYGRGTASAVAAFQSANGLETTGIADSATLQALYAAAEQVQQPVQTPGSLQLGDSGEAVTALKSKLRYLGYLTGSLSDTFDADTHAAVKAFQKAKSLKQDGVAGKKTLSMLDTAWNAARKTAGALPDEAVSFLSAMAQESGASCGTVVISRNGTPLLTWSFGGVDQTTCFRIASVTKWVTAIGLMTLYDQGRLDLDADINVYLPFKVRNPAWPDTPITARMLLSHTSSLLPNVTNYHPNWAKIGVKGYDPVFDESIQPGTQYAYADFNGALFGSLIEAITGESVQNYMNRTVFRPLGLTAAYSPKLLPSGTKTKDLLNPKGKVEISVQKDRTRSFNNRADPEGNAGYTVGRLFINAESLNKLAQMMLFDGQLNGVRILNAGTVALMEADQPGLAASRYGLSTVRLTQFPRGTWYGHQGRYSGLFSNVYYQRETGLTITLIMNGYDHQPEDNVVKPAVQLLKNMETLENACTAGTV